jgi:hypothetical protein
MHITLYGKRLVFLNVRCVLGMDEILLSIS